MLGYLLTAVGAFAGGFWAAALLSAGRRFDTVRAGEVLAEAVDDFAAQHHDRRYDEGDRVSVARSQIDRLQQALTLHDELRMS